MFNRWSPSFGNDQMRSRRLDLEEEGLHEKLEERFRKTLYYGELPDDDDCPSLPLTDLAVNFFQGATPRGLDQVNMSVASSLAEDACVSPGSLVTSMIYAKRLRHRNPEYLQKMSSSDLFFISVMMASKYMYDEGVDEEVFNDEWAEAANLEVDDVNQMEKDFLTAMDWQLFVSRLEFLKAVEILERRIAWTQSCDRGWLSYTDLNVLCHDHLFKQMWEDIGKQWIKVLSVSSAAYIAGVLTMVGSTALALQLSTAVVGCTLHREPHHLIPSQPRMDKEDITFDQHTNQTRPRLEMPTVRWNESGETDLSKPHPDKAKKTIEPNLFEKVLPQLWAVVAFKDKFVHLMYAFGEGLKQLGTGHRFRKANSCSSSKCTKLKPSTDQGSSPQTRFHDDDESDFVQRKCPNCPQCHQQKQSTTVKSCPLTNLEDASAVNMNHLKSNLNLEPWHCHGNRPPESADVILDTLLYSDIARGFATSVPVAA